MIVIHRKGRDAAAEVFRSIRYFPRSIPRNTICALDFWRPIGTITWTKLCPSASFQCQSRKRSKQTFLLSDGLRSNEGGEKRYKGSRSGYLPVLHSDILWQTERAANPGGLMLIILAQSGVKPFSATILRHRGAQRAATPPTELPLDSVVCGDHHTWIERY